MSAILFLIVHYWMIGYNIEMYLRIFKDPPKSIIQKGKAAFGTYNDISPMLDIKGMHAPYAGLPLPAFISNLRIKSRLDYIFATQNFIGFTEFFDFKIMGLARLIFWNKESGKKHAYFCFMVGRRRFIPISTTAGTCTSYNKKRYIKVFWGKNHQQMAMRFNVKGDSARPDCSGSFFSSKYSEYHSDNLFVNPAPVSSRCSATWFTTMQIQGKILINGEEQDNSKGLAAMMINRTYLKLHSISTIIWGLGTVKEKNVVFQLKTYNLDAIDSDNYNDNILIVDGEQTALPPVYMTHPFGFDKNWIIQDTESMVDLTFTPVSIDSNIRNFIVMRTAYRSIYGYFSGVLLDHNGQKIVLKNFPGIVNSNLTRL